MNSTESTSTTSTEPILHLENTSECRGALTATRYLMKLRETSSHSVDTDYYKTLSYLINDLLDAVTVETKRLTAIGDVDQDGQA